MLSGNRTYDSKGNDITPMCVEADGMVCVRQEEIARLQKELAQLARESVEREKELAKLEAEVAYWADAQRDGRLHVLPVKAGDTIYRLDLDHGTRKRDIATSVVISLYYYPQKGWEVWVPHGRTLSMSDFNKTWFLTREEAERAINE